LADKVAVHGVNDGEAHPRVRVLAVGHSAGRQGVAFLCCHPRKVGAVGAVPALMGLQPVPQRLEVGGLPIM